MVEKEGEVDSDNICMCYQAGALNIYDIQHEKTFVSNKEVGSPLD